MFTGLIQSKGKVLALNASGAEARLTLEPAKSLAPYVKGESIAVNGACLTVESDNGTAFTAYASAETLSRTNLGGLRRGDTVNLEKALRLGDSIGGHLVSGHVDTLCTLLSTAQAGSSRIYRLSTPTEYAAQIIPKGSVALDGISLTVNECNDEFFEVNIIPETQAETTIANWKPGCHINLETDLIGKYVEKMLKNLNAPKPDAKAPLDLDFFRNNGF